MAEQVGKNRAPFSWALIKWILDRPANLIQAGDSEHDIHIEGVTTDSRTVLPGNLFIALRGEKFDGHVYLQQAKDRGAVAAIVDHKSEVEIRQHVVPDTLEALGKIARAHLWRDEDYAIPVVAVTGSYGKTSTCALIVAALSSLGETLSPKGNFNNEIGLPLTLLQLEPKHEAVVLEMGMRGRGQIAYLTKIADPTIGVITNIGPQHIELLGSEENIALAKAELLEEMAPEGIVVLPADSPWLDLLKSKAKGFVVTFGTSIGADYRVEWTQTNAEGNVLFDLSLPPEHNGERSTFAVQLQLPGAHNAVNAAAAFAVAHQLSVAPNEIVRGLENAELPGARMRVLHLPNGTTIIDDCYNAGPTSMRAALQTLLDFPGSGRRVAVLGAMRELGEHSEAQHAAIGRFAGTLCDVLVGVDGETRPLLNAAVASAKEVENEMQVAWCEGASDAAARVGEWMQPGDVVLVKGSRSIGLETVVEALRGL